MRFCVLLPWVVILSSLDPGDINAQGRFVTSGYGIGEPLVAANPSDQNTVVVTAHRDVLSLTTDGGKSWVLQSIGPELFDKDWADPVPIFSSDGKLIIACLSGQYQVALITREKLQSKPVVHLMPRFGLEAHDKPWILLDSVNGKLRAVVFYSGLGRDEFNEDDTVRIYARQTYWPFDEWSDPLVISDTDLDVGNRDFQNGAVAVYNARHEVCLAWMRSDGIETAVISADFKTVLDHRVIASYSNGWIMNFGRFPSVRKFPSIAYDSARNTVCVVWTDQAQNGDLSLYLAQKHVDSSSWNVTEIPSFNGFLSGIAIDHYSRYYLITNLLDSKTTGAFHTSILVSTDLGQSFKPIMQSVSTIPNSGFIGDYFGLNIQANKLQTVWCQGGSGVNTDLYYYSQPLPPSLVATHEFPGNQVNLISTKPLRFEASNMGVRARVTIFDALGRILWEEAVSIDDGIGEIHFTPQASLLYFVRIKGDAGNAVLKVISD